MKLQNHILTIPLKEETTMDAILDTFHIARKQRYFLYQNRVIQVNGTPLYQSKMLKPDDIVTITLSQESDTIHAWNTSLSIVYEDDIFLIVDKPSGMLVHSDGNNQNHTLCNAVKAYYDKTNQQHLVRPIHRLDVETSGLVLFCKEPFFQPLLDMQLSQKQIKRDYQAIVQGVMEKQSWMIQAGISRDRHNAKKMRIDKHGKDAKTKVSVCQQYKDYALVKCQLFTGRTHQIRVHLASIHHPILSDPLYGKKDKRIKRCALHAYQLSFPHPLLQEIITCTCELPKDMKNLLTNR